MLLQLVVKVREVLCFEFLFTKPEKPHFGAISPKNLKTKLSPNKSLVSISSLYAALISCKKSETLHAQTFDNT